MAYTPGHASHHVSYFDAPSRVAFVGDTAGIRRGDGDTSCRRRRRPTSTSRRGGERGRGSWPGTRTRCFSRTSDRSTAHGCTSRSCSTGWTTGASSSGGSSPTLPLTDEAAGRALRRGGAARHAEEQLARRRPRDIVGPGGSTIPGRALPDIGGRRPNGNIARRIPTARSNRGQTGQPEAWCLDLRPQGEIPMNSRAAFAVVALTAILITGPATIAQMTMQPTARPIVTAENEPWYHRRRAHHHAMASSTTRPGRLPTSTATRWFVPATSGHSALQLARPPSLTVLSSSRIAGGLMHPYERRRDGDLAGTVGTSTPSFPVTRPQEQSGAGVRSGRRHGAGAGAAVSGRDAGRSDRPCGDSAAGGAAPPAHRHDRLQPLPCRPVRSPRRAARRG